MKVLSVPELAGLPWDSPVEGVAGVVQMVHPKLSGTGGWSLQNGRLEDASGQIVIEFMLSKHPRYWEPAQVQGRRVEFHSTREGDLVWKAQKAKPNVNRGRPFAKLEVAATARIVFAEESPALPGLDHAHTAGPPLPLTPVSALPVPADRSAPGPALRTQLRQMLVLHSVVERVVAEEAAPTERPTLTERLFAQACTAGLFRSINPDEAPTTTAEPPRPKLARLAEIARGREEQLNLLLRGTGMIRMDATWQSLSEEAAGQVLARTELMAVFSGATGS